MFNLIRIRHKKDSDGQTADRLELIAEYRSVIQKIHQARNAFQNITEPELIESCVHQMNALQAQYSFLLHKLKEENISAELIPAER